MSEQIQHCYRCQSMLHADDAEHYLLCPACAWDLLNVACRVLEAHLLMRETTPDLRDYWGKMRAMQRKAGEPPGEKWKD